MFPNININSELTLWKQYITDVMGTVSGKMQLHPLLRNKESSVCAEERKVAIIGQT